MLRTATIAACWAALSWGTACVQPNPSAFCDEAHDCPTGQACDLQTRLCVLPVPAITLDEPRNNQVITSQLLMLRGKIASDDPATASYSYGAGGEWQPLSLSPEGTFNVELLLPPLDSELLPVRVRATGAMGQSSEAVVRPLVDNVAPVLTLSPADGTQRAPPAITLVSSEPLAGTSASAWPASLSPDAGVTGTWNADRTQFWFRNLEPEAAYQVSVPADTVTDFAGNRNLVGAQGTVVTGPRTPEGDLTLSFGGARALDFEVAFDEDGVVSIAVSLDTAPQTVLWGWFSPRTGRFEVLGQALSGNLRHLRVVAARERVPGSAPERTSAVLFERVHPGTQELYRSAQWKAGANPVQARTLDGLAVVPGPGGCAEPSPGSVGLAVLGAGGGATYQRSDGSIDPRALPGGFLPRWVAYRSPDHWEWFDLSASSGAGSFRRQVWLCDCGASPSCGFLPSLDVVRASNDVDSGNAQLSMALTPLGRRLYVFNSMGGGPSRLETCYDCSAGPGSCTPGGEQAASNLWVASMNDGGKVLGARESGGQLELVTRDLESGCSAPWTWTVLGSIQKTLSEGKFRPVMFGDRPGLVYHWLPDGSLRLFIP